jgi:hypothetical protein
MNEKITENAVEFDHEVEAIRQNADLSDEAKHRMIQEAYDGATKRHQELIEEREQGNQDAVQTMERRIFEIPVPEGVREVEAEAFRQSYRDASFRVSGMDSDQLQAVLERAELTGDTMLARAVYHEARLTGAFGVTDVYLEGRPKERQRWENYTQQRQKAEGLERIVLTVSPQRPAELDGPRASVLGGG